MLVADRADADFFETVATGRKDPRLAAGWVINELTGRLNKANLTLAESPVSAQSLRGLLDLIEDDTISGRIAKDVFDEMFENGKEAADIVEEKGLKQITDTGEIEAIVDDLIANSDKQVQQYRDGNTKIAGWFVGQVMKATQGKANPQIVNKLLQEKLGG